jgi:hypothetical protein
LSFISTVVQIPLQNNCPAGQAHVPPVHDVPPMHAMPQPPQFRLSVMPSTHAPVQSVSPGAHMEAQALWLQTSPGWHGMAQPPQWNGSLPISTQVPAQVVVPAGQVQVPA